MTTVPAILLLLYTIDIVFVLCHCLGEFQHCLIPLDTSLTIADRLKWLVKILTLEEKWAQLTNNAPEILRLGIPAYNWLNNDIHNGVRNLVKKSFIYC